MSDDLQQAITAIKSGDKETGKRLLIQILKSDQRNETAWLWMTQVVTSNDERIKCLQNVLKINPHNETTKRGLTTFQQQAANQSQQAEPTKIETQEKPTELPSPPAHTEQQLPVEDSSLPRKLKPIEPQATKECPYCAEIIKANATVCRFCGRQLETGQKLELSQKVAAQKAPFKPKKQNLLDVLRNKDKRIGQEKSYP